MVGMAASEILIVMVFLMGGQMGLPLGLPPGPEDPLMSKFAPAECLFYTSWSSTVSPDASGNATERWLANPEIQESFQKLKSAIEALSQQGELREQEFGKQAFLVAERCLTHAGGFYLSQLEFPFHFQGGGLITLGSDAAEINEQMSVQIEALLQREQVEVTRRDIAGLTFRQAVVELGLESHVITWGIVNDQYLAIAVGPHEMESMLANMKTDPPEWLRDLRHEIPVDRTSAVTYTNVESFLELGQRVAADAGAGMRMEQTTLIMGVKNVTSAGWISGLDDQGFVCRGTVHLNGEPAGFLGLIEGEPLEEATFGKIAADRMLMTGVRISVPKLFALTRDIIDLNEFSRGQFDIGVAALNDMLDINLEEDVIETLDDHAYFYGSVNFANPMAGWVLGIGASRQMELTDAYNKINEFIESNCEAAGQLVFEQSEVNGNIIYGLKDTSGWGSMPNFTWTLADGELLVSLDKSSLRRHLRRETLSDDALVNDPWFADHAFSPPRMDAQGPYLVASLDIAGLLKMGLPLLSTFGEGMFPPGYTADDLPSLNALTQEMKTSVTAVFRTPEGFETAQHQTLPGGTPGTMLAAAAIGVMPASLQVRASAQRSTAANQMRQLILAMHNYHDATKAFPARFSKDEDERPLLSWRVHILPFLEQGDLYEQFHLDEPWDSDHNKALIERMPDCYIHPRARTAAGQTVFVVPHGEGSIMPDPSDASTLPKGTRLEEVRDGASRTGVIFEVSTENAVTWTKPDDFDWQKFDDPVAALFGDWAGDGVNVALADGSVPFISRDQLQKILNALITTNDGQAIEWDR